MYKTYGTGNTDQTQKNLMDRASLTLPSNPSFDLTFDSAGLQCRASDAQSKVVRLMSVPEHGEPS